MPALTLNPSAGQVANMQHDVGKALGLPGDATQAQVVQWIKDQFESLHAQVSRNEQNAAMVIQPLGPMA